MSHHARMMRLALAMASQSVARRKKVGCVIESPNGTLGLGYNHRRDGIYLPCDYETPSGLVTHIDTVHAEIDAVFSLWNRNISGSGSIFYVTMSPCYSCAIKISSLLPKEVFYLEEYRITDGIDYLNSRGILTRKL